MTQPAAIPGDEEARIARLRMLAILDSDPEMMFDSLTQLASEIFEVPIALVSLVDADRQWFKANVGLPGVTETPRDIAFCSHAILETGLMEVQDAQLDARFAANPLVTGGPGIRFYAGAPVILSDASRIGTFCVIDKVPRKLSSLQRRMLTEMAGAVSHAIEAREVSANAKTARMRLEDDLAVVARRSEVLRAAIDA
jgi:GAF domain-containing protein